MKKLIGICLFVGLCIVGGLFIYLNQYLDRISPQERAFVLNIKKGESLYSVAKKLKAQGVIDEPRVFVKVGQFYGYASRLKFGEYQVEPNQTLREILNLLASGKTVQYKFVLTEGSHLYDLAEILSEKGFGSKEEIHTLIKDASFIKELLGENIESLEGYLFPDTYYFSKGDDLRTIIRKMVGRFLQVYSKVPESSLSRHQLVTLASIIEKETGAGFERPIISSVFHNRLKKDMRLATDPTIIYGVLRETGKEIRNIRRVHLRKKNSYNTYLNSGLPPGPIGNPGKEALVAAAQPKKTDFLFFVSRNDGTHVFTSTYEDHQKAVRTFQLDPRMRQGKSWRDLKKKKL